MGEKIEKLIEERDRFVKRAKVLDNKIQEMVGKEREEDLIKSCEKCIGKYYIGKFRGEPEGCDRYVKVVGVSARRHDVSMIIDDYSETPEGEIQINTKSRLYQFETPMRGFAEISEELFNSEVSKILGKIKLSSKDNERLEKRVRE